MGRMIVTALLALLLVSCQGLMGPDDWSGQPYPGQTQGQYPNQQYPGQTQGQYPNQQYPAQQYPGQYPNQGQYPNNQQYDAYGQPIQGSGEYYRLGSGDRLRLIVFNEEELSGEFQVDGSGMVSLPLIGQMPAQGRTVREFEMAVESALRGRYLRDPRVSAEVLDFRPYYILGEVNKPGTYPYISGLTVLNAVATAEGFTYRANQRVVYIRRAGQAQEQQYPLNSTTPVNPGDTIRVAERIF